ncbi:MAG: hypothetical protein FRX48_03120 [Lasallia pustulata]|uniref:Dienelactone hydrolase domain-containing protein n=1 Tax=Lasallia pustulata TaxID=136370 RepID=A0A5M8PWE1_9LECA|nr:MAG: hypothetical protein FRX48_03120 [Lasallia pustulata]
MASHPPGQCCTVAIKHEGESTGEMKKIGDTETYFAYPPDKKQTSPCILLLTDVFGHKFINVQLLADQFAAAGYLVCMPDLFHGDPMPLVRPPGFDFFKWLRDPPGHLPDRVDPVIEEVMKTLRGSEYGVKKLGAVGYCYGAKYVIRGLKEGGGVDAGFIAHPSLVDVEELKAIRGPISIAAAETDTIFPDEKRHETEVILKEIGRPYQINLYSHVEHGFAVRCDLSKRENKYAKEQAFYQAVQWFDEHLKR